VAGAAAEELGLATPGFQGIALGPAVFRKAGSTATLLVSAAAVKAGLGAMSFASAEVLLQTAAGVEVDGVLYVIESVVAEGAADAPYCYALGLRAPLW
jgi:hypothetical protein